MTQSVIPPAPAVINKDVKSSPFSPVDRKHKPVTFCFKCFKPMELKEVAMTIHDKEAVMWDARMKVDLLLHLCPTCLDETKKVNEGGLKEATRRWEEMNKLR